MTSRRSTHRWPELKEAFARTLEAGWFIFGPEVEAFEREAAEKLGTADSVSCANGTDAIVLVLDAMGIGPGDEVICPSFTFYATAEAIARRGATPVFADIDPSTLNLDPGDVERRITERTKALMPVHLLSRRPPTSAASGCRSWKFAQAFGAGGIATSIASTFSFFPTKNLFALGDGGLISVNDASLARSICGFRRVGLRRRSSCTSATTSRLSAMHSSLQRFFLRHIDDGENAAAAMPLRGIRSCSTEMDRDAGRGRGRVYHSVVQSYDADSLIAAA